MPIRNSDAVVTALMQLGLAVDALSRVSADLLMEAAVADQDGINIDSEEALRRIEDGLAQIRRRLRVHRAIRA